MYTEYRQDPSIDSREESKDIVEIKTPLKKIITLDKMVSRQNSAQSSAQYMTTSKKEPPNKDFLFVQHPSVLNQPDGRQLSDDAVVSDFDYLLD